MKLLAKLTLFITGSKLLIVLLFVWLLPYLINQASFQYINYYLGQQKKKVESVIKKNGLDYYLQGDSAYASYTMLKEEYISLVPQGNSNISDTIETSRRIVEDDTLNYRILIHPFHYEGRKYVLEIGKTIATINQYDRLLQRFTLFMLIGLIVITILVDLAYTNILLRPLRKIVRTKLLNRKFPFREQLTPVKTSTTDFKYLDASLISLMEKIHVAFEKEREFTSNASHDLMTPISILQTKIENMMLDESTSDDQQDELSGLMKTVDRLKKIVHSLLFISRIENDQFAKSDTVSIFDLSAEVIEELSPRLENKSIRMTNDISSKVKIKQVNKDLIFQLIYNLVNNAIRYNKENGTIHLSDQHTKTTYTLFIRDTGTGIKQEEINNIFNRFKKSAYSNENGFGLGLAIVRSIVLFHGFEIKVTSEYGQGSVFSIVIPSKYTDLE